MFRKKKKTGLRTYTLSDKLRVLAYELDKDLQSNRFARAWRAFWSRHTDDSAQRDIIVWASVMERLANESLEAQLAALQEVDEPRTYDLATHELVPGNSKLLTLLSEVKDALKDLSAAFKESQQILAEKDDLLNKAAAALLIAKQNEGHLKVDAATFEELVTKINEVPKGGFFWQPASAGFESSALASFEVYRVLSNGLCAHPDVPLTDWTLVHKNDIEEPTILDPETHQIIDFENHHHIVFEGTEGECEAWMLREPSDQTRYMIQEIPE